MFPRRLLPFPDLVLGVLSVLPAPRQLTRQRQTLTQAARASHSISACSATMSRAIEVEASETVPRAEERSEAVPTEVNTWGPPSVLHCQHRRRAAVGQDLLTTRRYRRRWIPISQIYGPRHDPASDHRPVMTDDTQRRAGQTG